MSPFFQILKIIITSQAFQTFVVLVLDWLCIVFRKSGQRLKRKSQEDQQEQTNDDDDLFFE